MKLNIISKHKKSHYHKGNDFFSAWQRPTLAGGSPQLPLALKSLTTVFGMGTGVTSSLSPPNYLSYSLKTG